VNTILSVPLKLPTGEPPSLYGSRKLMCTVMETPTGEGHRDPLAVHIPSFETSPKEQPVGIKAECRPGDDVLQIVNGNGYCSGARGDRNHYAGQDQHNGKNEKSLDCHESSHYLSIQLVAMQHKSLTRLGCYQSSASVRSGSGFLGENDSSLAPMRRDVTKMQTKTGAIPELERLHETATLHRKRCHVKSFRFVCGRVTETASQRAAGRRCG
jgi:hypothetical protein